MIIFDSIGREIPYGRHERTYIYDKFEENVPTWLNIGGIKTISPDNDNLKIEAESLIETKLIDFTNRHAVRLELYNFSRFDGAGDWEMGIIDELGNKYCYKVNNINNAAGVSLKHNTVTLDEVPKFNVSGWTESGYKISRPRNLAVTFFPQKKTIALQENGFVVHQINISEIDYSNKFKMYCRNSLTQITVSGIKFTTWLNI